MVSASQIYRCISCGARWARHFPTCARCFEHGVIVPWSERARAVVDSVPAVATARELSRMVWSEVEQAAYPALKLAPKALVAVYGGPGQGKSTFSCRLADGVRGPALLISAEEALSPSLTARLLRANIKGDDFVAMASATVDQAVAKARQLGAVSMVVDSVQEATWTANELRHVIDLVDSLAVLVAVLQVTKAGLPAGSNQIQHEADVRVRVEAMRWSLDRKSRYQDPSDVGGDVLPTTSKESDT